MIEGYFHCILATAFTSESQGGQRDLAQAARAKAEASVLIPSRFEVDYRPSANGETTRLRDQQNFGGVRSYYEVMVTHLHMWGGAKWT